MSLITADKIASVMIGKPIRTFDQLAASAIAGPALMGYTPVTTSTSKTYIQMIAISLASAVNVILDVLLIPRYGLLGCAWATTATQNALGIGVVTPFPINAWRPCNGMDSFVDNNALDEETFDKTLESAVE